MTDDAKLLCVARSSGKIRWIRQLRRSRVEKEKTKKDPIRWTGPVLAGGRLLAVHRLGELAEISPADGPPLATTDLDTPLSKTPAVRSEERRVGTECVRT